jgi:hypothetical protein
VDLQDHGAKDQRHVALFEGLRHRGGVDLEILA